jgi:hypothetical protein
MIRHSDKARLNFIERHHYDIDRSPFDGQGAFGPVSWNVVEHNQNKYEMWKRRVVGRGETLRQAIDNAMTGKS